MGVDKRETAVLDELQAAIIRKRTTLPKVAAQIDCDYGTYWRYVKGKRPMPLHILLASLDALGVDPSEFMREAVRHMEP